jgi:hypothetical protein
MKNEKGDRGILDFIMNHCYECLIKFEDYFRNLTHAAAKAAYPKTVAGTASLS